MNIGKSVSGGGHCLLPPLLLRTRTLTLRCICLRGLGWLDDSMGTNGPSEEDKNFVADTGASTEDMAEQVAAYQESMLELKQKVVPIGGFWWQLMDSSGTQLAKKAKTEATCRAHLASICVGANATAKPSTWSRMQMYAIYGGGQGVTAQGFTDYTAEFLLTRGPYAMLGYTWCGCTNGQAFRPRAQEWDEDFGVPVDNGAACKETGVGTGVFTREWTGATVQWDCGTGHGKITKK